MRRWKFAMLGALSLCLLDGCGGQSSQSLVSQSQTSQSQAVQSQTPEAQPQGSQSQELQSQELQSQESHPTGTQEAMPEQKDPAPAVIGVCQKGDLLSFGHYEQDNDTSNGTEPIVWMVLTVEGDRALLLSQYGLDGQCYHENAKEPVTWEDCFLRGWLNEDFFQAAFHPEEQRQILTVTNENPDNLRYETEGGNDTEDRVFALSGEEVERYLAVPGTNEPLWAYATPYAAAQGVYVEEGENNGYSPWWLRSPGKYNEHNDGWFCASYVDYRPGDISVGGYAADSNSRAVRPAIWVMM